MKKTSIIIGSILIVVIAVYMIIQKNSKNSQDQEQKKQLDTTGIENLWQGINRENAVKIQGSFQTNDLYSYGELIALAEKGKVNLRSEIWKLRRQCPKTMEPKECDYAVLEFLKKNFPPEFAAMFEKYIFYEKNIRESDELKDLKDEERYNKIKELRRNIFPPEYVKLIFGREEAKMEFAEGLPQFLKSTEGLSGDERMREYENRQKKVYGDFYEGITDTESSFDRYQMELKIREEELNKLSDDAQDAQKRELQIKYFGEEGAERLEKLDQSLKQEKENESAYLQEKEKFIAENENLTAEEREKKLDELRQKYFGKDAESYKQREIYREYIEKQKK